ncbi:uncharacterized protein LOC119736761 [Patiria miniata]|uniref:Ig-like domain-containing protein n=1 Tax=Patiria miniata TaxID=46514 RepID=A0A914ARM2_PATMI|nr:uncharacterized protein LOC119736761 [Patiria miniata]
MTRRVGMQWVSISLLLCCGFVQVSTDGTVFLERGHRGIVPCPLVESCQIPIGDILAMYWFYGSTSDTSLLISYFIGKVAPQNGIPQGVYDIDNEFSLVIENVTAFNEGTYYFQVKPRLKVVESGSVEVCDKVSPSRPYPTVIGCNQDHDADTCEVRVRHDSTVHNLTCVMEQVKPAVQLGWIRLFLGGQTELNASTTVGPVVLPAYTGSSLRNNTYSTSASVQVAAVDDEEVYECEAMGIAIGSSTRTRVRLTKTYPTTATYDTTATDNEMQSSNNPGTTLVLMDEVTPPAFPFTLRLALTITILVVLFIAVIFDVILRGLVLASTDGTVFLERGQRGIVSCPLVESCQILGDILATYWHYGSTSGTSLLISYFLGRVAPQNGIPEGVYDIDDEFNLIIENVINSNDGTYYFQVLVAEFLLN